VRWPVLAPESAATELGSLRPAIGRMNRFLQENELAMLHRALSRVQRVRRSRTRCCLWRLPRCLTSGDRTRRTAGGAVPFPALGSPKCGCQTGAQEGIKSAEGRPSPNAPVGIPLRQSRTRRVPWAGPQSATPGGLWADKVGPARTGARGPSVARQRVNHCLGPPPAAPQARVDEVGISGRHIGDQTPMCPSWVPSSVQARQNSVTRRPNPEPAGPRRPSIGNDRRGFGR
jgi:hypothetical protein